MDTKFTMDLLSLILIVLSLSASSIALNMSLYRIGYRNGYIAGMGYMKRRKLGEIIETPRAVPAPRHRKTPH